MKLDKSTKRTWNQFEQELQMMSKEEKLQMGREIRANVEKRLEIYLKSRR